MKNTPFRLLTCVLSVLLLATGCSKQPAASAGGAAAPKKLRLAFVAEFSARLKKLLGQ